MRRFLLDNDFSNTIHNLDEDVERTVDEVVRECPSNVTTYLVCSGAGNCYWPTRKGIVDPAAKGLLSAHARGLDPLGMLLGGLKAAGKETFITYRMNDVHNPTDPDEWNTPRIRRENPDCIVGLDEVREGRADWMSYCLDYSREDVQRYVLDLIAEQVALYGHLIDGFQLDWMRFPRHLSGTPEEVWEKRGAMTEFIAQVRAVLRNSGRTTLLGARVPTSPAGCRRLGFDLEAWGARELVDLLVVCPFLTTEWHVPVADIRALLGNGGIPVYAGFDFGFGRQTHFPESLRGISTCLYDDGADGIYIFNFPCWNEYLAARPYHWLCGLEDPATAARRPLLLAAEHGQHRIVGVDQDAALPATLTAGSVLTIELRIPKAALPSWRGICLLHTHGDVLLAVNGHPAIEVRWSHKEIGAFRSEIFLEFADQYWDKAARPKPEDCRVFKVDPSVLEGGPNRIDITSVADAGIEIERVNLALW